jgi:predicted dehydrogenase
VWQLRIERDHAAPFRREDIELVEVVTQSGLSAANAAKKHGFARMSTDTQGILSDESIDVVLILTRHSSHADLVCDALRAGKRCSSRSHWLSMRRSSRGWPMPSSRVATTDSWSGSIVRFAPMLVSLKQLWGERIGPHLVQYRVNAGKVDPKSWYADVEGQGSRFVGEGGHFIDTVSWWMGTEPTEVTTARTPDDADNLIVTLRYPDGSTGVVTYATGGDPRYPKELLEVFGQGPWRSSTTSRGRRSGVVESRSPSAPSERSTRVSGMSSRRSSMR